LESLILFISIITTSPTGLLFCLGMSNDPLSIYRWSWWCMVAVQGLLPSLLGNRVYLVQTTSIGISLLYLADIHDINS